MNTLESWTEAACAELGLDPAVLDTGTVLDLARDAAHQVARPAAPLTAYLLGVAVGRGQPLDGPLTPPPSRRLLNATDTAADPRCRRPSHS